MVTQLWSQLSAATLYTGRLLSAAVSLYDNTVCTVHVSHTVPLSEGAKESVCPACQETAPEESSIVVRLPLHARTHTRLYPTYVPFLPSCSCSPRVLLLLTYKRLKPSPHAYTLHPPHRPAEVECLPNRPRFLSSPPPHREPFYVPDHEVLSPKVRSGEGGGTVVYTNQPGPEKYVSSSS